MEFITGMNYFLGLFQVLLSLPCITQQDLLAFEDALMKTASPKEQKQHMRSLLLLGSGNKLKALAAQKSVNVITNVSGKHFLFPALINALISMFNSRDSSILQMHSTCAFYFQQGYAVQVMPQKTERKRGI